jgi:hypothetical protein
VASQLILVAIGSGTRKMFMPKQKLHTHEEVFKDHVSGQYDETIFRFRVPGGWIYTHTIIRFGSVDKNYVADTFVPDLPAQPVDATQALNLSAGVSNCKVSRGRSLS